MVIPRAEGSAVRRALESVYRESLNRLGVSVSFKGCTPASCGKYVTNGAVDGEMARALFYNTIYPELVRTNEKVFSVNISAFSTNSSLKFNSWDDFSNSKYKVAYISAYYLIDKNILKRMSSSNIIYVKHWADGLQKLSGNLADIYIGVERTVLNELSGNESNIHKIGTLETLDLYPYFNKKHKLLSDKLAQTLKEMKKDGTMKRILSGL